MPYKKLLAFLFINKKHKFIMKKSLVILMAFLLVFAACNKDDEEEVDPNALNLTVAQKSFSIEYTSTIYSICGSSGGLFISKYPNDDYKHNFVIRACSAGDVMGELLTSSPAIDTEFAKKYTIAIDPTWKNTYAVAVIWKYDAMLCVDKFNKA